MLLLAFTSTLFVMHRKSLFLIGGLLLLAGLALLGYSLLLEPYTDSAAYYAQYGSIDVSASDATQRFSALRATFLTPKFSFQDYGITFGMVGLLLLLPGLLGFQRFRTPGGRMGLLLTGVSAAVLSCVALAERLHLHLLRGNFPHWADSLGIAAAAILVLCVLLLLWALFLLLLYKDSFVSRVPLFPIEARLSDWFLLTVLTITSVLLLCVVFSGNFWLILPGLLWGYFYLSILQGRRLAQLQML